MPRRYFPRLRFKLRKIKYPKDDPAEELLQLYQDLPAANEPVGAETTKKEETDSSLKILIETSRRRRRRHWLIAGGAVLLLLLAATSAGFFYFSNKKTFSTEQIFLEIVAPGQIKAGETFTYQINFANQGAVGLQQARLILQYPKELFIEESLPTIQNHSLLIDELAPGQKGELKIKGKILDEPGREQIFQAQLIFQPENFNSEFSRHAQHAFLLDTPDISLTNSFPANVTPGQKINLKTKIKNNVANDLNNVAFVYLYPATFQFQLAKPAVQEDHNTWLISTISSAGEQEIQVEGLVITTSAINSALDFQVQLLLQGRAGQYIKVKEESFTINIVEQALNTYLIINGSTENKNVSLGELLTFSLIVKNDGSETYNNLKTKMVFHNLNPDILHWNQIEDKNYGKIQKTTAGKEIIWSAAQVAAFKKLAPQQEVTLNFSIPLKTLADLKTISADALKQTTIEAHSEIEIANEITANPAIKSSVIILTLSSGANLGVKALYYYADGTPIGSGPIPLRAEQTTKLQIFWDLSNDLHEIKDVVVNTTLPESINWIEEKKASVGDLVFDQTTRQVIWKINRLPETVKEAHANFGIAVTPKTNSVGQILPLTETTTLTAKDAVTDSLIVRTKNILTTVLDQDKFAPGDGTIKP